MMTIAPHDIHHRPSPKQVDFDEDEREIQQASSTKDSSEESLLTAPARILVAEDDREFRALLAMRLRGAGFDVTEAADGASLLECLVEGLRPDGTIDKFDMILSDVQMPHYTALDVMVGARNWLTKTPIILITAFGDSLTHARARHLGAACVLDKPFRLDDLCVTICQVLSNQGGPSRPVHLEGMLD